MYSSKLRDKLFIASMEKGMWSVSGSTDSPWWRWIPFQWNLQDGFSRLFRKGSSLWGADPYIQIPPFLSENGTEMFPKGLLWPWSCSGNAEGSTVNVDLGWRWAHSSPKPSACPSGLVAPVSHQLLLPWSHTHFKYTTRAIHQFVFFFVCLFGNLLHRFTIQLTEVFKIMNVVIRGHLFLSTLAPSTITSTNSLQMKTGLKKTLW